jgi:hypothetical protein|tara:strand:+ start:2892 stop:3776 length:885 start_codon:yes stop_codon:yes gene_type:complete
MEEAKNMDNTQEQKVESQTATEPTTQEDIFAEVFGQPQSEEFVAKADSEPEIVVESQPSDVPSVEDPKNDNDSYKYWQSQADKRAAEVDLLKSQVTELMKAQASTPAEQPKEETVKIERPVKPRKPADYDHSEALADPESASGKYLAKQEQYMDGLADYMDSIEANRSKVMEQQIQQQEVFTRNQKVISDLQSQYNYTAEQANDFINKMSSPQSLSLDNLVKLHQMDSNAAPRQVAQVTPEALQKQQLMSNRQEKLSIPKPIGVQPGASTQSSKSVEDQMMDSMINRYKKKNPF